MSIDLNNSRYGVPPTKPLSRANKEEITTLVPMGHPRTTTMILGYDLCCKLCFSTGTDVPLPIRRSKCCDTALCADCYQHWWVHPSRSDRSVPIWKSCGLGCSVEYRENRRIQARHRPRNNRGIFPARDRRKRGGGTRITVSTEGSS